MSGRLQIEWKPATLEIPEACKELIVRNPVKVAKQVLSIPQWVKVEEQEPMKVPEFWTWLQTSLQQVLNLQLEGVQARAAMLEDQQAIQFHYLQQATMFIMEATMDIRSTLEATLRKYVPPITGVDEPESMDWEPTMNPKDFPGLIKDVED